jgi:hypothetical protein
MVFVIFRVKIAENSNNIPVVASFLREKDMPSPWFQKVGNKKINS